MEPQLSRRHSACDRPIRIIRSEHAIGRRLSSDSFRPWVDSRVFPQPAKESYGDTFGSDLLEQYKLYVQSAENVSARRVASNRYLLTLNAALVALYGVQSANFGQGYWTLLIPVIGIPVSLLWYLIIKSHADLNRIKFKVIHELEQHLPAALYKYDSLVKSLCRSN